MTKYQVIDSETGISIKWYDSKEEAQEQADFMTSYHSQEYEVAEVEVTGESK